MSYTKKQKYAIGTGVALATAYAAKRLWDKRKAQRNKIENDLSKYVNKCKN